MGICALATPREENGSKIIHTTEHVAKQRRDYLHKLSTEWGEQYDLIALEDLRIRNMVRNKHLSKSILDSGWSSFRHDLTDKAASAGREGVFVDPAHTSKRCSNCGALYEGLTLKERWVQCDGGLSLDRAHNAAITILARARPLPEQGVIEPDRTGLYSLT